MNKTEKAINFIKNSCPRIGGFYGTNEVYEFIDLTSQDIIKENASSLFPERYKEHIAYALSTISKNGFLSPPSAVASAYLVTRFEFFFRLLSGFLKADGNWVSLGKKDEVFIKLGSVNEQEIGTVYKILKLNKSLYLTKIFEDLDQSLFINSQSKIKDIGDRIAWCRHRSSHGEWGDISSEAVFYGLVTALIFYNQN